MALTRYTVGDDGTLVDRDGNVLGRITTLTLDTKPANSGADGGDHRGGENTSTNEQKNPHVPQAVQRVWDHYVSLFGSAFKFDAKAQRIIKAALKVRPESRLLRAIEGLHVSPFHNGENDQRKTYLHIRYALAGNQRTGQTIEERIDDMATLAERHVAEPPSPWPKDADPVVQGMLRSRYRILLAAHEDPTLPGAGEEVDRVESDLAARGFIVLREPDGRPRIVNG